MTDEPRRATPATPMHPSIAPRSRFSRRVALTPESIASFATASGDDNPLHHDPRYAARTRFNGVIASGPQTSALLMGLTATHFSRVGEMVGLEFSFRFRAAVRAGSYLTLEWMVIRVKPSRSLRGYLVDLRGRARLDSGETAVGAKGTVLVLDRL